MGLNDVRIVARDGGLKRRNPSLDGVSGMLTTGVAAGTLVLGESNQLKSVNDLTALGVAADYDTANNVKVYHHVEEFFRLNPDGELWLMVVAQTVSLADMCDVSNAQYLLKLLSDAKGKIRQVAVGRNPVTGYTATTTGGMDTDVFAAIPLAQALAEQEWIAHRPVFVLLEGRSFTGSATAATDLRTLNSGNVGVTILQDKVQADAHAICNGYAAIGTTLGAISKAAVNVSIMQTATMDIQSVADKMYLSDDANDNVNLSSHLAGGSYSDTDLGTLKDKGYLFAVTYTDTEGVYFCDSSTCAAAKSDCAYIENTRAKNKAVRILYPVYVKRLGAVVEVDPDTGYLEEDVVSDLEETGEAEVNTEMSGEVSAFEVVIKPKQNLLTSSELDVDFVLTPTGTLRNINGTLRFTNPFNA